MQGRVTQGGLVSVFDNCVDPSEEGSMNTWHNRVHVPDITRTGALHDATRYVNPVAMGTTGDLKYLTIYETDLEDVRTAWSRVPYSWHGSSTGGDAIHPAVRPSMRLLFQRHGRRAAARSPLPGGL